VRIEQPLLTKKRLRTAGIAAGVTAAHLVVFALIANSAAPVPFLPPAPPINVILFRPPVTPPPPPPPPLEPTPDPGGGAPAAPSRIHVPPKPPVNVPQELPAPVVQAPEQPLVIGRSADASPTPGMGQGGTGNGTGTGDGDGEGPGSGGIGPRFIRGATQGEIFSVVPRGRRGEAYVNCVIRVDERLDNCRIVSERPAGQGYGSAGITIAQAYFRFRPPMSASGRPVEGQRVTVFIRFGPGA
jgi:protein TonB